MRSRYKGWPRLLFTALVLLFLGSGCTGFPVYEQQQVVEGAYDAETRYDMETLAGALSGSVQSWENPDQIIKRKILERIEGRYGAQIAGLVDQYYGQEISNRIRTYAQDVAPAWLLSLPSALDIVDKQLKRVDVQTSVLLAEQPDGSFKATQLWNGISVFRAPSCRDEGGLSCEQIQISIQDLLDAEYPIDLVNTEFSGNLAGDTLSMASHEVRFNYGRLALYLMTNLVLPDKPGAGLQLRDVVLGAINCRGLAGRLAGEDDVLGWTILGVEVGVSFNELLGSCEDGVFGMVNGFIDQFNVPLKMNLSGSLTLLDDDYDGTIDQLVTRDLGGDVNASLITGQSAEGPVSGQLIGFRVGALPDDGVVVDDETTDIDDGVVIFDNGEE